MVSGIGEFKPSGIPEKAARSTGLEKLGSDRVEGFSSMLAGVNRNERDVKAGANEPSRFDAKPGREARIQKDSGREGVRSSNERDSDPRDEKLARTREQQSSSASEAKRRSGTKRAEPMKAKPDARDSDVASATGVTEGVSLPRRTIEKTPSEASNVASDESSRVGTKSMQNPAPMAGTKSAGRAGASIQAEGSKVVEETLATLDMLKGEQGQVRAAAMEEFLSKMQSELGVPPERILEAFGQLDGGALLASPEESAEQFVANLELPDAQAAQARSLYGEMVKETNEADLNEKFAGLEAGVNFEVLSKKDASLRKLNGAIDEMNGSFFMREGYDPAAKAQPLQAGKGMIGEDMETQIARMMRQPQNAETTDKSKSEDDSSFGLGTLGAASALGLASVSGMTSSGADGVSKADRAMNAIAGTNSSDAFDGAMALDESAMAGMSPGFDPNASQSEGEFGDSSEQKSAAGEMAALDAKADSAQAFKLSGESSELSNATTGASTNVTSMPMAPKAMAAGATAGGAASMMFERPTATPQQEQENIRELIKQAQVILKKGGGEMKLEMSPEGMGHVNLKVSVKDGQVNIQMLTENDATKRTLEKGLDELRSSLASHSLKVENLKVDVGDSIQKNMEFDQEQAREQARQFASDFMGGFRDERQSFREGLMGQTGWKQYGRGSRISDPQPDDAVVAARSNAQDGSRRLNLVA